ncbi:InlB B-repeat-containing protein [[Ruminococcus] lactaris]|uniref:Repeat protein n=14 Tax=[Ruminococcus] lactaris TaxID=46228 RepID=B5CSD0_9FIRM|nr:InlB B-repeat-containing protein [[Ruminococcus] lactaris]EDY31744.1 repeat protein [[Ruminococcus] lactaris ATCC 29176]UWP64918.1 InlB B-repeat-containing protein [[Ruminococcus] lactaris ATCC 29176]
MKKRILSILLLCCMVLTMVLTMLPTTAFAAGELPDVKLSVPTTFDKTVDLTKQNKELKIKDSKTYLIKGSADPNWYFQYRIKIDGKNNTPHIFLDGVRLQAPKDGPAIELYGGASACLYFIGGDSELIGTENFAALQKNKTDGYLRVLVRTGTKFTCKGGTYGAGIGGSKVGIKKFSQGHGVNLHFGSLATDIYSGEISATSGPFAAGIGGGANGGVGEQIYVYSGKLTATSVSQGAGIGGGQGGPGRFIYIRGGTVVSSSRSAGAGIGSGDQDGLNEREDAHHIEISGGAVLAFSNYAGAGIGGGRDGSGCDISITGGVVQAQGYFGAGIGGGMNGDSWNILIKDTTLTALAFPLYPSSDYTELSASAVGRGSNRTHYMSAMKNQEDLLYEENIKIGASDGKSVRLSATGWQWHRSQGPYEMDWGTTTELLIPNENGRVDLQRLSLPYAYNYGRVISKLELRCVESTCSHEFGWANRDGCHIWACKNCGARDPAAEMSKQNGKHIPGDWSNQEQFCTVCGHVLERDTKAPVMETLTDGESYTVEDTLDGKPGAYTFTVSDPAASGETSSGVKSVTINGVPQDGPTYRLPAPDGGNNDAGAEYTVVATDNAGNETTATVRTYRRHHEHSYSDWSKDGTSHWHECTDYDCPNRNKSIKDKAAHDYTDDADTICNVCGYERTVTPPAPAEYTITVTSGGNGTASTSHAKAVAGTEITLTATPNTGYHFKEWEVMSGGVTIKDDKFLMPGSNVEVKAIFEDMSKEQFTLAPGGTYYFDLSGESIPGTANDALPDSTMHYVPFTYAGTVDAYKLTSEMATTEEYAQQNEYAHSLFVADYAVTHAVSWDKLHAEGLIFGKGYAAGSVEYTMRAPSGGSAATSNYSLGTPQSNEWDRILDKNGGYIKNWGKMESWGQDTSPYTLSNRVVRGYHSPRKFADANTTLDFPYFGFRPVLEVLNPDTLGTDGLKAVTLDLGGGKLGGSPDTIQIIVKTGESFTAPASDGLTRPDGNTGSYFKWRDSNGKLYAPGDNVPADVTRLTAQFDSDTYTVTIITEGGGTASASYAKAVFGTEIILTATPDTGYHFKMWQVESPAGLVITNGRFTMPDNNVEVKAIFKDISKEQFTLAPGGTYYFDLSGESIPGTANDALPDSTMHYVPFTYAGTVDAYKLTSEMATTEEYAQQNEYAHSLFVADYAVTHAVSWDKLHAEGLIFGKGYAAGSVEYTMRAPSGGSAATSNYSLGTPQSNEWDRILDKNGGYIKNWGKMESWGQDTSPYTLSNRVVRGYHSPRKFADANTTLDFPYFGFRPVLEVLNPDTLGTDGLKAVTLDLGGGKLGGSPDTIQIIVKTGESFTAPASDGLTRPDGNTGSYFKWLGSDGNLYAPGDNVPAVVTRLTAQFDSSSHSVTITFNGNGGTGTMDSVTVKAGANYTLPACGFTEPEGKQFKGWSTSADGSVISGTTYEVSSDTTFYAIWESKEYSIIVTDGKATIGAGSEISKAAQGTTITLTANAAPDGKVFDKWVVESGSATLEDANSETTTFIMPDSEVSVKATYKNAPVTTYSLTTQVNGGHGTISASKTGLTEGSTETVTFTPDDGYEIDLVTVNGVVTDVLSNILNVTMDADKTVIVTYKAIPHTHTYDQEIQKPETLKSAADCTNDAVYFKSCSCGEISTTETFTAAGTQLGHAWASDWSKDTDNHWKECSRCHEKKDEAAHDYGSDNICDTCGYDKTVPHTHNLTLVPAKAPTCTEKGNTAYYTCDGCDKWFEDATGASEITDKTSVILAATGHSVSDWKSDHTDHWKECTVVGCGVIIEDSKAAHTAGEWIIDTPATATTSGSKHKECTVCGYMMATETIPATGGGEHTHSYGSDWKYDADNHWHECSCGDKADKAAHTAGEWIIDTPATATTSGSKHKECTVCSYTMTTETIPATGGGEHTHSYGSDWKYDADNHWHECSCGDKADKAAHDFKWVVDKEATATQKGSKHEECKVCGYKKAAVEILATGSTTKPTDPTQTNSNTGAEGPKTGDNSNMILWIALLFISGGAVIGITVYSKKKKENAE